MARATVTGTAVIRFNKELDIDVEGLVRDYVDENLSLRLELVDVDVEDVTWE